PERFHTSDRCTAIECECLTHGLAKVILAIDCYSAGSSTRRNNSQIASVACEPDSRRTHGGSVRGSKCSRAASSSDALCRQDTCRIERNRSAEINTADAVQPNVLRVRHFRDVVVRPTEGGKCETNCH